jgi:hypothetical protein
LLNLYIIVFFVMFCPFSFFHCIICHSSIYGLWFSTLHTVFSSCHCIICHSSIYTLWFSSFAHSIFFFPLYCLSFFVLHPLIFKLCTQYFLLAIVLSALLLFTPSDFQTLHLVFSSCHCIICPSIYTLWSTNFAYSILFFEFLLHSILIVNYHLSMIKL